MNYAMRHGRRIEVDVLPGSPGARKKGRKGFAALWVKLPRHWISGLAQTKSVSTYRLAHLILLAAYEDKRGAGMVTLSGKATGYMPSTTRHRSVQELVELGLVTLVKGGGTTKATLKVKIVPQGG